MTRSKTKPGILCILGLLLYSFTTQSQIKIQGTVHDAGTGLPLSGATVLVKTSQETTLTGADGKFNLTVPAANSLLLVSYIGYESKEI